VVLRALAMRGMLHTEAVFRMTRCYVLRWR
jgi:hypothetical protein